MFWILVVIVGVCGAIADILIEAWSRNMTFPAWLVAVVPHLVFLTGLGGILYLGKQGKLPLTVAVILVVVINITIIATRDISRGEPFPLLQRAGVLFCLVGVVCIELGRRG